VRSAAAGLLLALFGLAQGAWAQNVTLNGSMGDRALLIIDGKPRTLKVGAEQAGVKLVSVGPEEAQVEVQGKRLLLRIGAAPVNLGQAGTASAGATEIVLTAGTGGHFVTGGQINGKTVQFMVDTGATLVSMSQADAARIGLDLRGGRPGVMHTANGSVPMVQVSLASVRIGGVEVYGVEALVSPGEMPFILLGNSFLTRFQLRRDNDTLRLTKKP
jgi:aspartyl protease family protein